LIAGPPFRDSAAAGYNFGLLLRWLAEHLRACLMALTDASHAQTV
jgi:hypothetical protein